MTYMLPQTLAVEFQVRFTSLDTYGHNRTVTLSGMDLGEAIETCDHTQINQELYQLPVNAETILTDAIGVLKQRGRSFGVYLNQQGEVCVLGALALAAGKAHDRWEELNSEWEDEWEPGDAALVEAARKLLNLLPVEVDFADLPIEDLVFFVGRWHDGLWDDEGSYEGQPATSEVFAKLAEAARLAKQAAS